MPRLKRPAPLTDYELARAMRSHALKPDLSPSTRRYLNLGADRLEHYLRNGASQ